MSHPIARAVSTPISDRARTVLEEVRSIRSAVEKCLCVREEEEDEKGVESTAEGSSARILDLSGDADVGRKEGEKEKQRGQGQGQEGVIVVKTKNKSESENGENKEKEGEDDYRNLDREIYSDLCSVHVVMQQVRGEGKERG